MNRRQPLVSICIPTYNGSETIEKTLNEIVPQLNSDFEIIINDDSSTDNTFEIVKIFQSNYQNIKVSHNKKNLGMDGNFHRTTQLAAGKYIWFCGQDDILGDGILQQVYKMISNNKDIGILNLNFSQYDHHMKKCLIKSFFEASTFDQNIVKDNEELYFNTPEEYYKVFTQPPSFLPSVVMLREYWLTTDVKPFYGTFFVQLGVLLLNMHKHRIGVFTTPLIKGRIPDNQWQEDGSKLFSIMTGDLVARKIAFNHNKNLPSRIYNRDFLRYTLNLLFLVYNSKVKGYSCSDENVKHIKIIYGVGFLYYFYAIPLLYSNKAILMFVYYPLNLFKKTLFLFDYFKRIRL
jgi:glycosyltransferase involved in cell wall biosynthesis